MAERKVFLYQLPPILGGGEATEAQVRKLGGEIRPGPGNTPQAVFQTRGGKRFISGSREARQLDLGQTIRDIGSGLKRSFEEAGRPTFEPPMLDVNVPPKEQPSPPQAAGPAQAPSTAPPVNGAAAAKVEPGGPLAVRTAPEQAEMVAQRMDDTGGELGGLISHLPQADLSPELAALKAAIDAPEPVFKGLAFNVAEKIALGFLAGLRGPEAVTPIIDQRRRDAMQVYQAARAARAERLQGLATLAGGARAERGQALQAAQTAAQMEETRTYRKAQLGLQMESLRQGQQKIDLLAKKQSAAAMGKLVPINEAAALGEALDVALSMKRAYKQLEELGFPGNPIITANGTIAWTDEQKKARELLQGVEQNEMKRLLGAARTVPELASVVGPLPPFGSSDSTIRIGLLGTASRVMHTIRTKLWTYRVLGYNTSALESQLDAMGFSGMALATPAVQPPPGMEIETGFVLMEE